MDEETIRKEFEEWLNNSFCTRSESGEYRDVFTQEAWLAWLEATRRADKRTREECAEICSQKANESLHSGTDRPLGAIDCEHAIRATIKEE